MKKEHEVWVFAGDSITADPAGYVGVLTRQLGLTATTRLLNAGRSGDRSIDLLRRFESEVLAHEPSLVVISIGINDVWHGYFDFELNLILPTFDCQRGVPLETFAGAIRKMALMTLNCGAQLVLVSPTSIGDVGSRENLALQTYARAVQQIAGEIGVPYCPMFERFQEALSEANESLTWDGVHMTSAGASLMAAIVADSVRDAM